MENNCLDRDLLNTHAKISFNFFSVFTSTGNYNFTSIYVLYYLTNFNFKFQLCICFVKVFEYLSRKRLYLFSVRIVDSFYENL